MNGIDGKVAIVTVGAQSIGARVVRAFHRAGARVVIADIAEDPGRALAAELGEGAHFQRTDIGRDEDIAACVAATVATFGGLDFVINAACTYLDDGFASGREDWLRSLDVNLVGGVMMVRAAHPQLRVPRLRRGRSAPRSPDRGEDREHRDRPIVQRGRRHARHPPCRTQDVS